MIGDRTRNRIRLKTWQIRWLRHLRSALPKSRFFPVRFSSVTPASYSSAPSEKSAVQIRYIRNSLWPSRAPSDPRRAAWRLHFSSTKPRRSVSIRSSVVAPLRGGSEKLREPEAGGPGQRFRCSGVALGLTALSAQLEPTRRRSFRPIELSAARRLFRVNLAPECLIRPAPRARRRGIQRHRPRSSPTRTSAGNRARRRNDRSAIRAPRGRGRARRASRQKRRWPRSGR